MVRYADDFVILCRTADEAERALELVQAWVTDNGLTLHPTKTRIVDARTDGFDFLGYHFRGAATLAAGEEPPEAQRQPPGEDPPNVGRFAASDRGQREPDAARLVRLLPAQHAQVALQRPRWLDPNASAQHASPPTRRTRSWPATNEPLHLAQFLLRRARAVQSVKPPMPRSVNPHEGKTINRRAGCGKTARPVRREERPKPIGRSYPYQREGEWQKDAKGSFRRLGDLVGQGRGGYDMKLGVQNLLGIGMLAAVCGGFVRPGWSAEAPAEGACGARSD